MKRVTKLLGITVFATVIGLGVAGCDNGSTTKKTVVGIAVNTDAMKTEYVIGEDFKADGMIVTATYNDASTEPVTDYQVDASEYDKTAAGIYTIKVTYKDKEAEFTVTVRAADNPLVKIEVTEPPTKTQYNIGDQLDITGLELTAYYTDETSEKVTDYTIGEFDSFEEGSKTITVSYGGKTAEFTVTVSEPPLESIAVTKEPDKTTYDINEALDLSGIEVTAYYKNDYERAVTITAANITGFDSSTKGTKTVTVTYKGEEATFEVEVIITITKIEITPPDKTIYLLNETLDTDGLAVTAFYSDNSTEPATVTSTNISGFSSAAAGEKTITITYEGKTATFTVTVLDLIEGEMVTGNTLAEQLAWLDTNAANDTSYILVASADEELEPRTLSYSGKSDIILYLVGSGSEQIVSLSGNGSLFTVNNGVKLILDNNITLQGHDNNNASLVYVSSGGELVMNAGAKITGNSNSGVGGGVYVQYNATFEMSGGEISGNTVSSNSSYNGGGGVFNLGTFEMSGGKISGNTASVISNGVIFNGGGGVYVYSGTFEMDGGEISGNTSNNIGGGVYVYSGGTFEMSGGEISGNTSNTTGGGVYIYSGTFEMSGGKISSNTASVNGGGVAGYGTFTMTGGTISGNIASNGGGIHLVIDTTFEMSGGEISGNTAAEQGGGVYVRNTATFNNNGGTISGNDPDDVYENEEP